jgi:hypothetical protein
VIEVYENYCNGEWLHTLLETLKSANFWQYTQSTDTYDDGKPKFTHVIYHGDRPLSDLHDFMQPFYNKVEVGVLIRNKIDFNLKTETQQQSMVHQDIAYIDVPYKTGILYLNTNNGYTLFEDGTKVESVANRFVIFDGNMKHCALSQTDTTERFVLNINWIPTRIDETLYTQSKQST